MRSTLRPVLILAAAAALWCAPTQAAVVWDESISGDLSNTGLSPTPIVFSPGSNVVVGTVGNSGQGIDRDYFTFAVPTGTVLTSLLLLGNTSVSGGTSFLALQSGPQVTVTPAGAGVENLLGFLHYDNSQIGTDLLPTLVFGFSGSLPSGIYSAWVQETGGPATYGLDFQVTPVPLPAAVVLLFSGLLGAGAMRRRAHPTPSIAS